MNQPDRAEEKEAARLEEFLQGLRQNPSADPHDLDPELAEVAGLTVEAERASSLVAKPYADTARNRVWQKALASQTANQPVGEESQIALATGLPGPKAGGKEPATGPIYLLPDESVSKGRKVNWPQIVLGGMAATIVVILGILALLLIMPGPQNPTNIVGAGTSHVATKPASQATPTLAVPTAIPQPTPTPYPLIKLNLQIAADKFTTDQANATARVLENRMLIMGFSYAKSTVTGNSITLNLRGTVDATFEYKTAISVGRVEFVDISGSYTLKTGDYLQTSYCTSGSLLKPQSGLCVPTTTELSPGYTPIGNVNSDKKPFQTILTGDDMNPPDVKLAQDTNNGGDKLLFKFKPEAAAVMKTFTEAHLGQPMAITVDRQIIVDATVQGVISDSGEITSPNQLNLTYQVAFIKSGPLPLPLYLKSVS